MSPLERSPDEATRVTRTTWPASPPSTTWWFRPSVRAAPVVATRVFLDAISVLAENVGSRRLVIVGGAGSLQVAPGLRLMDLARFPSAYRPEAVTQAAALELLRDTGALADWVYVSPAPAIGPGERLGRYRIGRESPIGDFISAEDFAVAIVDEIETPRFRRTRFNVAH